MSAQDILERVSFFKQVSKNSWACLCPSHNDKSPSLRVTETTDGKILLKCWSGCSALDVLTAIGLSWSALFPNDGYRRPRHQRDDRVEDYIVEFAEYAKRTGKQLTQADKQAYARALKAGGRANGFTDRVIAEASK